MKLFSYQSYNSNDKPGQWSKVHILDEVDKNTLCGLTIKLSQYFNYEYGEGNGNMCLRCEKVYLNQDDLPKCSQCGETVTLLNGFENFDDIRQKLGQYIHNSCYQTYRARMKGMVAP